jgi:hypothetical protein
MQVNSGAAPDAPSLAPADLHVARGSVQGDRNSEVPMPIAQAGARRTLQARVWGPRLGRTAPGPHERAAAVRGVGQVEQVGPLRFADLLTS